MNDFPIRFHPAWWVPGGHAQTLWGKIFRRQPDVPTRAERWETTDGDFLEVHRLDAPQHSAQNTPHVLLLHGLEGTVHSHYAQGLLGEMRRRGWSADLLIWRSCGSEPNRARRFYHSGETDDLDFVLKRITRERPNSLLGVAGVSLGGNIMLKYLGEIGQAARTFVVAAAAVSVPFDLGRGSDYINHGFSKLYQKYFLDSLKQKAIEKQSRYPDLPSPELVGMIQSLRMFDDTITAPVHGFRDAIDYYERSSSVHYLMGIAVDTLLLNAFDDPFLPSDVLDRVARIALANPHITVEFLRRGGHAGFIGGRNPFNPLYYLERRVGEFLAGKFAVATVEKTVNP
ncbi:MAG: hydrolase [Gemmatimonadaceae bacterium]